MVTYRLKIYSLKKCKKPTCMGYNFPIFLPLGLHVTYLTVLRLKNVKMRSEIILLWLYITG